MPDSENKCDSGPLDPVFIHARREACIILVAWACCLLWTVGYYRLAGYDLDVEGMSLTFGMPSWVFYGVLMPWMFATVFSVGFSLFVMREDDLGEHDGTEAELSGQDTDSKNARGRGDVETRRNING